VREDRLQEVKAQLEAGGHQASTFPVDVSDPVRMEGFAQEVIAAKGRVDVLINNAGVGMGGELKDTSLADFRWLMGINFWGVVHGVHFFLPAMIERRSGHIVNIASLNGLAPFPFDGPYNASKFGVIGYSETLRAELARFKIGVTAVCPGLINTNLMNDGRYDCVNETTRSFLHSFRNRMARSGANPLGLARQVPKVNARNQALLVYPSDAKLIAFARRWFPWAYGRVIAEIARRKT
jgi:short-subunit dehydrogenase